MAWRKAYLQGIALNEKLATEFPDVPNWRAQLNSDYAFLGNLLRSLRRHEDAEKAYRKAIEISEKLTAEFPAISYHWQQYIESHARLDRLLVQTGRPREAAQAYGRGATCLEKLASEFPSEQSYRQEINKTMKGILQNEGLAALVRYVINRR